MRLRSRALSGMTLAAVFTIAGCEPSDPPLQHGFVKLDAKPLEGSGAEVFAGTTEVLMSMQYDDCLRDFYGRETSWSQDGVDGHPVFSGHEEGGEGWFDRLCDDPETGQAECEVIEIKQFLEMTHQLQVRVRISEPNLEQQFLKFGPIPLPDLAGCPSLVRVTSQPMQGFSGTERIWESKSWDESVAAPGQGKAIRVRAGRI